MHDSPKVSVIIPCYNHGAYLDEAVDSVLAQSYENYEIIIVNDGSSDPLTNSLLETYSKPKTRVLTTTNQGLAAARNNGIKEASGAYILPLDADDKIGPRYLEKAVSILENNPDIGIVYCRALLFGEMENEWILPEYSLDAMLLDNVIFCSSFFRKKQWEQVGGYDPEMIYGWEDWDFWLSLIEQGALVYKIPEILFHYRITADSMVRSKSKKQKVEIVTRIYHKHQKLFSNNIHIWADKILDRPEESYITRLLVDTGDGFNDDHKIVQKLDPLTQKITFDLSHLRNIKGLQFYPVNDYCVIHLGRVELVSETGYTIELTDFYANTVDGNKANLVFTNDAPYLNFDFPELGFHANRIARFIVTLSFLQTGKGAFFYLLKRKEEQIGNKQKALEHCRQELDRCSSAALNQPASQFSWQQIAKLAARKAKFEATRFRYRFDKRYRAIKGSGIFDEQYYLDNNPDLRSNFVDPVIHYIQYGHSEGRNPHPLFETGWYWFHYPEIAEAGENPLYHYAVEGWKQGYNPHPMFETAYYLKQYPHVKTTRKNPLAHYIETGAKEGCKPNPLFDTSYYIEHNKDTLDQGENPLVHYIQRGVWEGRATSKFIDHFSVAPKISIITPVYNVAEQYLRACIESVVAQSYENWELCLVDDASTAEHISLVFEEYRNIDPRIKVKLLDTNVGISGATNAAAEMATGDYLAFLDNDDELTRNALLEVVRTINLEGPELIYSDECIIDKDGGFIEAHHKPDYSPDLLLCHNYITHFLVLRRSLFDQVGGVSSAHDGAQDYDLLLKVCEQTDQITHIPKVLYRWRSIETSTSANPDAKSYADIAGKRALENALQRRNIAGDVFHGNLPFYYRVKRTVRDTPLISILIPFRDQPAYLKKCVTAVLEKSSYTNYEIIGVSNNSSDPETHAVMEQLSSLDNRVSFYEYNEPFNYSAINNYGVDLSQGEHLVLMNNDIEIINSDWIEAMLEHSQRDEVGAVGAKLYYPDDTVQHAGVIIGIGGFAGHGHRLFDRQSPGYFNRLHCIQNISAVTAALLMVKKDVYLKVGGLNEEYLGVALNDIDLCLKIMEKGYLNIFTPYAEAYHFESISRGYEDTPEKKARFKKEVSWFRQRWSELLAQGDPYFNPNLNIERDDFSRKKYATWYESEGHRLEILEGKASQD